jgi:Leucine-rich repeat (LRR) protein
LDLSFNDLADFPTIIFNQPLSGTLEDLYLQNNKISEIPISGWESTISLKIVDLSNNSSISVCPSECLEKGNFHNLSLAGTSVKKKELEKLPGLQVYIERRKGRMDMALK